MSSRLDCPRCLRPKEKYCVCHSLCSFENPIHVTIWRHPTEEKQRFKTAHLAGLQLKNSRLHTAENATSKEILKTKRAILIYPNPNSKELSLDLLKETGCQEFLFLDGTWKKTRKIFYSNAWINELQSFHLPSFEGTSKLSVVRRSFEENHLSTLEAIAACLEMATGKSEYLKMNDVLDLIRSQHQDFIE